ncbi:MAG: hypothetical protein K6D97_06120 [Clostridia bacterium]|nr:hypothetical protein [Clostridia bacterium]
MFILDNKKTYFFLLVLIFILISGFVILYYLDVNYTKPMSTKSFNFNSKEEYDVKIGFFEIKDNIIVIHGYVFDNRPKINKFDTCYVLKNSNTDKYYKLNTIMKKMDEIEDENISNRGMYTKAHLSFLPKGNYELFIFYNNNDENFLLNTDIKFELE